MKRLLFVTSMLLLVLGMSLPVAALPAAGPPLDWSAHPPIHVRPYATGSPTGYSPAQIKHAYGFDAISDNGNGQTIAIVDAYDDPTVQSDLDMFNSTFGFPVMNSTTSPWFQKVYAQGTQPRTDPGWALEISLDVQWAHAIAPGANILLVEAATNSFSNLMAAVDKAVAMGADVVSMSWGGSDFSSESSYDYHFNVPGVVFTAASGDSGAGVIYPAASPYVLGVGGTTLPLDDAGNLTGSETAWSGSGGGISGNEGEPGYQTAYSSEATGLLLSTTVSKRGIPDVSYNANPNTGFSVYDSTRYNGQSGWWEVGGTSAGAPQWAALVAIADEARGAPLSTSDLNSSPFYAAASGGTNYQDHYYDILTGSNGGYSAGTGYDFVTGLGSPIADRLVPDLAQYNAPPPSQTLSLTISTDKGAYKVGQTVHMTFTVTSGGVPISGVSVSGTVTGPSSSSTFSAGPTDGSGTASYPFPTSGLSRGTYTVTATAAYGSYSPASATDTFKVR